MKAKHNEMKGEMKGEMKEMKDEMKGEMKGAGEVGIHLPADPRFRLSEQSFRSNPVRFDSSSRQVSKPEETRSWPHSFTKELESVKVGRASRSRNSR